MRQEIRVFSTRFVFCFTICARMCAHKQARVLFTFSICSWAKWEIDLKNKSEKMRPSHCAEIIVHMIDDRRALFPLIRSHHRLSFSLCICPVDCVKDDEKRNDTIIDFNSIFRLSIVTECVTNQLHFFFLSLCFAQKLCSIDDFCKFFVSYFCHFISFLINIFTKISFFF